MRAIGECHNNTLHSKGQQNEVNELVQEQNQFTSYRSKIFVLITSFLGSPDKSSCHCCHPLPFFQRLSELVRPTLGKRAHFLLLLMYAWRMPYRWSAHYAMENILGSRPRP